MWTSGRCEKWGVRSGLVMSGVRGGAVMSSDMISEVWEVELWWVGMWQVVMKVREGKREREKQRERGREMSWVRWGDWLRGYTNHNICLQLLQESSSARTLCVLRLPRERQPGRSLYCACHAKPAAAQQRPRAPQLRQDAVSTAPATRKAARKLSVLRLPREASRGPAAPTRAAAPPGRCEYCACHAKGSQEAVCTAPATRSQPRPSGAHAHRSSARTLCVLRLPRERQPGSCLYCACHAKRAAAQRRPRAPQLHQEALCTAPATRKAARKLCVLRLPREASRGPAAPTRAAAPPGRSVYCACHEASRGPAAPTRAAAPPGRSVYCACHAKGSQDCACHAKPAAAQRRPRAPQLRQEALFTVSATRKAARKLSVLRLHLPREGVSEWARVRVTVREREWVSEWVCECDWVSEWVCECEWVSEWMSEWVEWVSEWGGGGGGGGGAPAGSKRKTRTPHSDVGN